MAMTSVSEGDSMVDNDDKMYRKLGANADKTAVKTNAHVNDETYVIYRLKIDDNIFV